MTYPAANAGRCGFVSDLKKHAWVQITGLFGRQAPLQRLCLLVGAHFLLPLLERVEGAGGDLLGVALLHIEAPGQGGIHETDMQGEHLNTLSRTSIRNALVKLHAADFVAA